jgi:hypothetical protein
MVFRHHGTSQFYLSHGSGCKLTSS